MRKIKHYLIEASSLNTCSTTDRILPHYELRKVVDEYLDSGYLVTIIDVMYFSAPIRKTQPDSK